MQIKTLKILGFSEATLTMVFDILETNNFFPEIKIINNIGYTPVKEYVNNKFNIEILDSLDLKKDDLLVLGAAQKSTKIKLLENFKDLTYERFYSVISNSSEISSTTKIGNGCIINSMTCIAGHTVLGDFVFVNRSVSIGHHTKIGNFTTINPGSNIAGNVEIGSNCQIGIGCNIFDGVKIGDNSIIGAGSLVTKNIPDNVVAYGNPCKIIKKI
jgi:sugar O-acyltransferase (sialic acid O-acetyltransferase NeuD family)